MSQSDDDGECEDWDDCYNHPSDGNLDTEASRDIGTAGPTFRTRGKLQAVVNTLHQVKWSFKQFLHAWMKESCELRHRRYRTFPQRQKALQQTLAGMPKTYLVSMFTATFTAELDALITKPYFGRFDHTAQIDDIDFDAAFQTIRETAPTWHTILVQLLPNSRAHQTSYNFPRTQELHTLRRIRHSPLP